MTFKIFRREFQLITTIRLNVVIETSALYDSFSENTIKKCDIYDESPKGNLGSQRWLLF